MVFGHLYILKYCFKRFLFDNLTLIFILNNLNFWVIVLCSPCWSWTHYELKSGPGLLILLPSAPRRWDNKFVSPSMALSFNLNFYVIHIIINRFEINHCYHYWNHFLLHILPFEKYDNIFTKKYFNKILRRIPIF